MTREVVRLQASTLISAAVIFATVVLAWATLRAQFHDHTMDVDVHMPYSAKVDKFITRHEFLDHESLTAHPAQAETTAELKSAIAALTVKVENLANDVAVTRELADQFVLEVNTLQSEVRHIREILEDQK